MEIRLQRKRRRLGWPWLLILIAPFAYLAYWSRGHRATSGGEVVTADSTSNFIIPRDTVRGPDRLADLSDYLARADTSRDERRQREFVANAFALLANAVGSMRGADAAPVEESVASMRRYAETLRGTRGRQAARSDSLRAHFIEATSGIDTLRVLSYPQIRADEELRRAARALQPGRAIETQREAVRTWFTRASRALETMRGGRR